MKALVLAVAVAGAMVASASEARAAMFDFDAAPVYRPFPIDLTSEGITAHFDGGFYNYSIQSANVLGFTPAGFSGNCVYPGSIFLQDLTITFDKALTDFSILYCTEEYGSDVSGRMRATGYLSGALAGTNTQQANGGTWPTATLTLHAGGGFDKVLLHYDGAPAGTENWGPIFMSDNMSVTAAAVTPEPATLAMLAAGASGLMMRRRRRQ